MLSSNPAENYLKQCQPIAGRRVGSGVHTLGLKMHPENRNTADMSGISEIPIKFKIGTKFVITCETILNHSKRDDAGYEK